MQPIWEVAVEPGWRQQPSRCASPADVGSSWGSCHLRKALRAAGLRLLTQESARAQRDHLPSKTYETGTGEPEPALPAPLLCGCRRALIELHCWKKPSIESFPSVRMDRLEMLYGSCWHCTASPLVFYAYIVSPTSKLLLSCHINKLRELLLHLCPFLSVYNEVPL